MLNETLFAENSELAKKNFRETGLKLGLLLLVFNVLVSNNVSFAALRFFDSGTDAGFQWQEKWFADGNDYKIEYTKDGMKLTSGVDSSDNAGSVCLWTIPSFSSDYLRIEYDFTKLDNLERNAENILIIQAIGIGGAYPGDISKWERHRLLNDDGIQHIYSMKMHNYLISYSTTGNDEQVNKLRGRHNRGFALLKEYSKIKSFQTGTTYHVIVEKEGLNFSMTAINKSTGVKEYFSFIGRKPEGKNFPAIQNGRVGLYLMAGRISLFKNIKIVDTKEGP